MHLVANSFDFDVPRNTTAFVCGRVRDGAPVLYVSHIDVPMELVGMVETLVRMQAGIEPGKPFRFSATTCRAR